jgi:hypothetical protein
MNAFVGKICLMGAVIGAINLVSSGVVGAQEAPLLDTPRARIVDDVLPQIVQSPPVLVPLEGKELLSEPDMPSVEPETKKMVVLADKEGPEEENSEEESPELDQPSRDEATNNFVPSLAPFYVTGAEYVSIRHKTPEQGAQEVLVLDYEISSQNDLSPPLTDTSSAQGESLSSVHIVLAADYVAVQTEEQMKIYDFKLNRVLEIRTERPKNKKPTTVFSNTSLFAKVYKDIALINAMTQGGQQRRLKLSEGKTLDAFWVESAKSWAASLPETPLEIETDENTLMIKRADELVFSAQFDAENLPDDAQYGRYKNTFLAFAHHELPLHPLVLKALHGYDSPPQSMDIVSYNPRNMGGQKQSWTLVSRAVETRQFPLPKSALGAAQHRPIIPLNFLIDQAARGQARGGRPDASVLHEDYQARKKSGDALGAWLAGQKYVSYTHACQGKAPEPICAELRVLAQGKSAELGAVLGRTAQRGQRQRTKDQLKARNNALWSVKNDKFQDFVQGFDLAQSSRTRALAVDKLRPYLNKPSTPAIILSTAAMARAGLKPQAAVAAGVSDVKPRPLLERALAQDPYNPHTYLGLAQVLAAQGAYVRSWDVYDAMRAGISGSENMAVKIDRLEAKLRKTAPGYFLQP